MQRHELEDVEGPVHGGRRVRAHGSLDSGAVFHSSLPGLSKLHFTGQRVKQGISAARESSLRSDQLSQQDELQAESSVLLVARAKPAAAVNAGPCRPAPRAAFRPLPRAPPVWAPGRGWPRSTKGIPSPCGRRRNRMTRELPRPVSRTGFSALPLPTLLAPEMYADPAAGVNTGPRMSQRRGSIRLLIAISARPWSSGRAPPRAACGRRWQRSRRTRKMPSRSRRHRRRPRRSPLWYVR